MTVPKFLNIGPLLRLYPLSKIIGGSNNNINKLTKCFYIFFMYRATLNKRSARPANIPKRVVRPAS